jgi:hypothetical protein
MTDQMEGKGPGIRCRGGAAGADEIEDEGFAGRGPRGRHDEGGRFRFGEGRQPGDIFPEPPEGFFIAGAGPGETGEALVRDAKGGRADADDQQGNSDGDGEFQQGPTGARGWTEAGRHQVPVENICMM